MALGAFILDDGESRDLMRVYHSFAAAALTDRSLRRAEFFEKERGLFGFLVEQLPDHVASRERAARASISLVFGLSLTVLLEQCRTDEAPRRARPDVPGDHGGEPDLDDRPVKLASCRLDTGRRNG